MEAFLMEKAIVKAVIGPVDLDTGANTGNRVDMKDLERVTFICAAAAGTTPSSHTFTLKQHTLASAGTSADLEVSNPYYHQLAAATSFTKVQPSTAAAAYDLDSIIVDAKYVVVFEVLASQLTDGYRWVSLDQTDAGGAQIGVVLAIGHAAGSKPSYSLVV